LVEQIPAVVFMASFDEGAGEAYVSPQIESMLGFTQQEWLGDPVLWYRQLHPEDKARWSLEASHLFLSANRCARYTGLSLETAARCGFIARPRWCGAQTDSHGFFTGSGST
jgi:hypothetical protein